MLVAVERLAQPDGLVGDGVRLCLCVIVFFDPRRADAKSSNIEYFAWLDPPEIEAPVLEEGVGVGVRDLRGTISREDLDGANGASTARGG